MRIEQSHHIPAGAAGGCVYVQVTMIAQEIMTTPVVTVPVTASLADALETLAGLEIRHLPVISTNGEVAGVLSDRDIRALGFSPVIEPESLAVLQAKLRVPVSTLMSGDVLSVEPTAELAEVVDLMLDEKVGALPVVDGETNEIVGIISYVDILRAARDLF